MPRTSPGHQTALSLPITHHGKVCTKCRVFKSNAEFRVWGNGRLLWQCTSCKSAYDRMRWANSRANRPKHYPACIRRDALAEERINLLVRAVLEVTGIAETELVSREPSRPAQRARDIISWVAVRSRVAPARIIAQRLQRKRMAISRGVERAEERRQKDDELRALTDDLRAKFRQ